MKSLQNLLLTHILVGIFITFFLVHGHITRPFLIVFLLALPVLNKGQRFQKIKSKKNTPSKRISLLYSRMLTTTLNEFYGLEISRISNHLHHFYSNLLLYSLSTL